MPRIFLVHLYVLFILHYFFFFISHKIKIWAHSRFPHTSCLLHQFAVNSIALLYSLCLSEILAADPLREFLSFLFSFTRATISNFFHIVLLLADSAGATAATGCHRIAQALPRVQQVRLWSAVSDGAAPHPTFFLFFFTTFIAAHTLFLAFFYRISPAHTLTAAACRLRLGVSNRRSKIY